jgi:hypothetical protein
MLFSPDDIVEFVDPLEDEVGTTYRVVEVNGDRCIIELVCDMRIRPTWVRLVADLKRVVDRDRLPRFVLASDDGRMVTYDTSTGPSLTANRALSYVWTSMTEAEAQRHAYQTALGVPLVARHQ